MALVSLERSQFTKLLAQGAVHGAGVPGDGGGVELHPEQDGGGGSTIHLDEWTHMRQVCQPQVIQAQFLLSVSFCHFKTELNWSKYIEHFGMEHITQLRTNVQFCNEKKIVNTVHLT
jgi:hypothetical protein